LHVSVFWGNNLSKIPGVENKNNFENITRTHSDYASLQLIFIHDFKGLRIDTYVP